MSGGVSSSSPWEILPAVAAPVPLVFASPHSGRSYRNDFLAASRLDPVAIRRSEDAFVDEIFASAPRHGAPLLRAHFPRAFVDPNREAFELDPDMFEDPLPAYVNVASSRVAAGLGTIARVVATGEEIYAGKLRFADVRERIEAHYVPYHQALRGLITETRARFGACLLVDCHSMPSVGGPMDSDPGLRRVDVVLGDCHGTSCARAVIDRAEQVLAGQGLRVMRNHPYAGGYTTRHYGRPAEGVHALQIELNRSLYMDETRIAPAAGFPGLCQQMEALIISLATFDPALLRPASAR